MRDSILKILKKHFQYNDYKLGKIADEILLEKKKKKQMPIRSCFNCIYSKPLIVTYIGDNPNLCQRGRVKGDAINCPYYSEYTGVTMNEGADYSSITRTFR